MVILSKKDIIIMKETSVSDRLTFLAETFDVFDCSTTDGIEQKLKQLVDEGKQPSVIKGEKGDVLAILGIKRINPEKSFSVISVCSDVFSAMIAADPTENKMYLQWMLNIFTRSIKEGDSHTAIRLVEEDLPQANVYLTLFESNKRKRKFKELCNSSYSLTGIKDPTNINQYKSLSVLFDAVDPFIEKEPSAVERTMQKFVSSGQAIIPMKDRKFTVYIPKTTAASVIFENFASWCTAREGNGMFNSYTTGHKKPNGQASDLYVIVNNKFFSGESDELYQIHFETKQLKNKSNGSNVSIFESVISESEGIANFFKKELTEMAMGWTKGIESNIYVDYLIEFGFTESLFDMIDSDVLSIKFTSTREIPRIADLSKFTHLEMFVILNAKLTEIHPSIGRMTNLELLSLPDNKIKVIPKEIGNLKNLAFLNLSNNPITDIPEEIKYLDKGNGGKLFRLTIKKEDIGEEAYARLKKLLPNTEIQLSDN